MLNDAIMNAGRKKNDLTGMRNNNWIPKFVEEKESDSARG